MTKKLHPEFRNNKHRLRRHSHWEKKIECPILASFARVEVLILVLILISSNRITEVMRTDSATRRICLTCFAAKC